MGYFFGIRSKKNLKQCHPDLQRLFNEVIKSRNCAVLVGHRGREEQNQAYYEERSTKLYPTSKHNKRPSLAADVVPWFSEKSHIRWNDREAFYEFGGFVQGVATKMGIRIRWGGNWDMDDELHDQTLFDLPHFELV